MSQSHSQRPQNDLVNCLIDEIDGAADFVAIHAEHVGISSAVVSNEVMTAVAIEELTREWLTAVSEISFNDTGVNRIVAKIEDSAVDTSGAIVAGII